MSRTLALALSLVFVFAGASSVSAAAPNVDAAAERLRTADVFSESRIGYSGELSSEVAAWRVVLRADDAAERFASIAKRGTAAGRLYAAIGLRALGDARFEGVLHELRLVEHTRLTVRSGCLTLDKTVGQLVEVQVPGAIRLRDEETIADWFTRTKRKSGHLDVIGGGYGAAFLE